MNDMTASFAVPLATRAADPQRRETARGAQRRGCGLSTANSMEIEMAERTIGEMMMQVPQGETRVFAPALRDPVEERYFRVYQSWDYQPMRLEWLNLPPREGSPWNGTRTSPRIPITSLPPPDVRFHGPAMDVVDFYNPSQDVFFISDPLFRLIEEIDPGSLEQIPFGVRAKDAELAFRAVMPVRVLEAIDPQRTRVLIEDEDLAGTYFRRVLFPDGIVFNDKALQGVASFSDVDAGGWYWSRDLLQLAQERGMRGLYAQSVASSPAQEIARL